MMLTCPKCGDYYADASTAFCLADGTPLVGVGEGSERWGEGARVVEEKAKSLRRQTRKLKWRRVVTSAMATLVTTMVVCVLAINSLIYLKPKPEEVVAARPSTPAAEPMPVVAPAAFTDLTEPGKPDEPVQTPTPEPTVTPRPTASPITSETTAPPRTPTPTPTMTPTPTPSPTPIIILTRTPTPTPAPTPTPTPECSDADKSRERESIIKTFGESWRRKIEGERPKIIKENVPDGGQNAEASLSALEYPGAPFKGCVFGVIAVRYSWQVRANVNGTIKTETVAKERRFTCVKIFGAWGCR